MLSWLRSTRAAPWTWPARSQSACPACSASWTSGQTSTPPTSMVGASCGKAGQPWARVPGEGNPGSPRMMGGQAGCSPSAGTARPGTEATERAVTGPTPAPRAVCGACAQLLSELWPPVFVRPSAGSLLASQGPEKPCLSWLFCSVFCGWKEKSQKTVTLSPGREVSLL